MASKPKPLIAKPVRRSPAQAGYQKLGRLAEKSKPWIALNRDEDLEYA